MKSISTGKLFILATLIGVALLGALIITTNNSVYSKFTLPLKIQEYFDYSCPHCQDFETSIQKVKTKYNQDVQVEYIYFNLFPASVDAANAAEAARNQNKYVEYHDAIFAEIEKQKAAGTVDVSKIDLQKIATDLKLDMDKFNKDRTSAETTAKVDADRKQAEDRGISSTPTVYINGVVADLVTTDGHDFSPFVDKIDKIIQNIKQK